MDWPVFFIPSQFLSPPPLLLVQLHRYIPVAVWGSKDLLKRAKYQQQETKQHQSRLEVIVYSQIKFLRHFSKRSLTLMEVFTVLLTQCGHYQPFFLPGLLPPTIIPAYQSHHVYIHWSMETIATLEWRYGFWLIGPPVLWVLYSYSASLSLPHHLALGSSLKFTNLSPVHTCYKSITVPSCVLLCQ